MSAILLNLVLLSPMAAFALGVAALIIPSRWRVLVLLLPTIGALWGAAGSLGFLVGARHFRLLDEAGQKLDYVFEPQVMMREMLAFAGVTLVITTVPLLALRRNWSRQMRERRPSKGPTPTPSGRRS